MLKQPSSYVSIDALKSVISGLIKIIGGVKQDAWNSYLIELIIGLYKNNHKTDTMKKTNHAFFGFLNSLLIIKYRI